MYTRVKSSIGVDLVKKTINYIIVFCLGLMFASSGVFAAVGDVIEAKFGQFTFMVDGEKKELEADPLVYQGSTYLPVRVVANLVGKDVVYKADTKTIELNTPKTAEVEAQRMIETTLEIPIEEKIKMIEARIIEAESSIELWMKTSAATVDKERKAQIDDAIEQIRQKLAERKAEKAALEAQQ